MIKQNIDDMFIFMYYIVYYIKNKVIFRNMEKEKEKENETKIQHLVISGGGQTGFYVLWGSPRSF